VDAAAGAAAREAAAGAAAAGAAAREAAAGAAAKGAEVAGRGYGDDASCMGRTIC
jgi:hypothetical protein